MFQDRLFLLRHAAEARVTLSTAAPLEAYGADAYSNDSSSVSMSAGVIAATGAWARSLLSFVTR